jgi:GGDEF domain-containing protein
MEAVDLLPEPCEISMSIGASYFPNDSTEAEELLSTADLRMYKTKRNQHPPVMENPEAMLPLSDMNVLPLTYQ